MFPAKGHPDQTRAALSFISVAQSIWATYSNSVQLRHCYALPLIPHYATSMWQYYWLEDLPWSCSAVVTLVPYFLFFRTWNMTQRAHDSDLETLKMWLGNSPACSKSEDHCASSLWTLEMGNPTFQFLLSLEMLSLFYLFYMTSHFPLNSDICTKQIKLIQLFRNKLK